jgi:D-glycero-D-manno-heptose 1,7-bisphosphate phosphatase
MRRLSAVLFDRDGTLIKDVPYNGDPSLVVPLGTAAAAVRLAKTAGLFTGVITNQSGVARGMITRDQVDEVNSRVDELVGPFDTWHVCPHGPDDGCGCRKPAPGMIFAACMALNVDVKQVVVIGDVESDLRAAENAGARAVLVPTPVTRVEEVRRARVTASNLLTAVDEVLRDGSGR